MLVRIINHLNAIFTKIINTFWYRVICGRIGRGSYIVSPAILNCPEAIFMDNNTIIHKYSWIFACSQESKIKISEGTQIGHFFHCVCKNTVVIDKNVLIADKVFVSDCTHKYTDINTPIMQQEISEIRPVIIGENSWIGENCAILGASIGKHCVIGANSVVVKDIEDYCVAVGNPAKVVKKYNFVSNKWEKINVH